MGLLQAGIGALTGVLADQWREYFYCEGMSQDVLVKKGVRRNANNKGHDNIISNGAIIAVNEGQCMMIVEQGAIVEFSAQPGEFVWDSSSEPSIFYGNLSENLKATWEILKKRFTLGGDPGKDQRIYYFNTKEIVGNKYGTANPVPFRVVDKNIGLDIDIGIRCFGEYSYKMADPMLFYKNVCGNVSSDYRRDQIESQLKTELLTALQPAFAKISEQGIRYSALPGHTDDLADALNDVLSEKWAKLRGLEVVSFGVSSVKANEEDEKRIKELQANAALKDPAMAAAHLTGATAAAMQAAAANEGSMGAAMGFMGMNMAQNATAGNINTLYGMASQSNQQSAPSAGGWTCPKCGTVNTGKFCSECGTAKPVPGEWTCSKCGTKNTGKFCSECGAPKE
ncbi:MAG: SPFH domain-containing protein [Clostridiales bacterium]|nr:SPFH domain-containing protein [Clostridiales bacterium]